MTGILWFESYSDLQKLQYIIYHNMDYQKIERGTVTFQCDKEKHDARGRSPLMLAVTLGHLESARVLLQHATNVNTENKDGWTVVQEAVATGDPELLQLVLERRDYQRYTSRAPDFYVEMKWEFTSWVPLVSRMCPSDTYKVYKQGSNVRIDTTLLGFDQTNWQRGNRSYIFKGQSDSAIMMEVDHETQQVYVEKMRVISPEDLQYLQPSEDVVSSRLTTPIVTTYIDTDKISFERNKSGVWGWRSDKSEQVNGHECKVFSATNVELVTKTRTEHLTETDKVKARAPKTPLQSFLGIAEVEEKQALPEAENVCLTNSLVCKCCQELLEPSSHPSDITEVKEEYCHVGNPCNISPEEYFDETADLSGRDIGRPKEINTKIQKFKVEIPLFHVLNARITFGNIFGLDEEIPGVTRVGEDERMSCVLEDACFVPPPSYTKLGAEVRRQFSIEEEDELLQFAIQQSLIEAGSERDEVDIWEALRAQRPSRPTTPNIHTEEERQLQRAIQASLALYQQNFSDVCTSPVRSSPDGREEEAETPNSPLVDDDDLQMALVLSQREREEEEKQRKQEEEMLQQILQLSLTEK
uniref:Ankyrin repeat domain-containing protein n=1 Tax=Timema shepardi TaxID=629360 RepID=A0A7R9G0F8_TIMSH|nr:unnamed protein product [Timema shepardi]